MIENAVGGKGESSQGKALAAPAAVLRRCAAPRRRIFRVELRGHDAERRGRQPRFQRAARFRLSPRKRGPRGYRLRSWVPGLASLARDTSCLSPRKRGPRGYGLPSWVPGLASRARDKNCVARVIDEKDVVPFLDARSGKEN